MPSRPLLLLLVVLVSTVAGCSTPHAIPDFAAVPYEPFNRQDAVAIALREWRLFGSRIEEDHVQSGEDRPPGNPELKPERMPGLWERVGEYWWLGLGPDWSQSRWTGKHDQNGRVFPAWDDENYAWSAAFISYVMRIAGAGERFPYAPNHATYVNAAASGRSSILKAHAPQDYALQLGDLICFGREWAAGLHFSDLPTHYLWPGHCAIVVAIAPGSLEVVGGNVDDAVEMTKVAVAADGGLVGQDSTDWFVVLQVLYDAETDPG